MKTLIISAILILSCTVSGAGELTPAQKKGEILFQILNVADIGLTMKALDQPNVREMNPILGEHPSDGKLALFGISVGILHYVGTRYVFKSAKSRKYWLWGTNIIKAGAVGNNLVIVEW